VELIVSSAIVTIAGWLAFLFLNAGLILFAKNTAMNVSHQQARIAIARMQHDLHSAVSIPQLVNASRLPVTGNGPAAGVSFQVPIGQNCRVNANAIASDQQMDILVPSGYSVPVPGLRLIVPTHTIEQDITSVTLQGPGVYRCGFASPLGADVTVSNGGSNYNIVCFLTKRVSYVVISGELRYFPDASAGTSFLLASSVTNPTPFQTPVTAGGEAANGFVGIVNLSTNDSTTNQRGYRATNFFLNTEIPNRVRLTKYQ
jgi:hypothetical protein